MRAVTSVLLALLALATFAPVARAAVVLLSLAEWQEDFGVGGPSFPSRSSAESSLRPRLVVVFTSPTGPAP
jgi:hypothetical protein